MKTGLVLEGGSMRGLFSAGVTDVLMEAGVVFDGLIGVSAGAAFGCNYKSNQPGRAIRYNVRFCQDARYCSLRSWLRTGDLYGADFCYREIPETLDPFDRAAFDRSEMEFQVVCTDARTGRAVYHACAQADRATMDWIRASASMPLAARPVVIDGVPLLDGGIADSIPLRHFEEIGYRRNVVILTQPAGFIKQPNRQVPLVRLGLHRYPRVAAALKKRHEVYNATVRYVRMREAAGAALVICPPAPLDVGAVEHDGAKLRAVYRLGRAVGAEQLSAVQDFLRRAKEAAE